ncbi:hypothetical protein [Marinomonas posidonica]|uniref:Uncharacterized protein n=1 Tax=Marinomonas posidonica (strain CECT 7376 / NCIMB 14433 / IVIA-Po-181) TaxID=491952 RepID=F6CS03_MARPP|nr:hypothetical protein [Marinomonas posidonica]AEF56110.1 hypothetical protein Mar181_3083 [Marinomonas posidonica IVIA-Po-181]
MGTSITTWDNVSAYFTFADNPLALMLFSLGVAGIVVGLIRFIMKHEKEAFENHK